MSSALARAAAEKKSTRILRRDERKPVDESVASSGINRAGTKEVTKNPTRVVPELPGFHQLTKLEITRDTRDIDKRSILMNVNETDSEDELENAVPVTMRPPCNVDSLIHKKKNRLDAWVADKSQADKDVNYIKEAAAIMRGEFERVEKEQDLWCSSFEMGRGSLTQSIIASREEAAKLARDLKLLYNLTLAECGPSTRKRRTVSMRDAIAELQERKELLEAKLFEYAKTAAEAKGDKVPITSIELDETKDLRRLPEDTEAFKMLYGITADRQVQQLQQAAAALPSEGETIVNNSSKGKSKDKGKDTATAKTVKSEPESSAASRTVSPTLTKSGDDAADANGSKASSAKSQQVDLTYSLEISRGDSIPSEESAAKMASEGAEGPKNSHGKDKTSDIAGPSGAPSSSSSEKNGDKKKGADKSSASSASAPAPAASASAAADSNADKDEIGEDYDDGDASKNAIRSFMIQFNTAEEAVKTASKQIGDIDIFLDNLDHNGMPPGAGGASGQYESSSSSSSGGSSSGNSNGNGSNGSEAVTSALPDHRMLGAVDRGSDKAVVEEALREIRALVEGPEERRQRSVAFEERYNTGEKGLREYLAIQAGENSSGRKRRRIASSMVVKSYVYPRTPRGQPLLVSPLSQFEDKYLGVVAGGVPGTNLSNGQIAPEQKYSLPRAADSTPPFLATEEDFVMKHCSLQSASASSETKLRRLHHNLGDWRRQLQDSAEKLDRAKAANDAAMREDTIECKRIRRELQAFGISSIPLNTETPLSPIAETSGWGKEAGGDKRAGGGKIKSVGLGRGRASGSMAALQKGNNRKTKEWRGPPRHLMSEAKTAKGGGARTGKDEGSDE